MSNIRYEVECYGEREVSAGLFQEKKLNKQYHTLEFWRIGLDAIDENTIKGISDKLTANGAALCKFKRLLDWQIKKLWTETDEFGRLRENNKVILNYYVHTI